MATSACLFNRRSTAVAAVLFGGALGALALAIREPQPLRASTNQPRADSDLDGLTDLQENVLGTMVDRADSDLDGYSDLEERARSSDPLSASSIPGVETVGVGTCASVEYGVVSVVSAVYVADGDLGSADLQLGVIHGGHALAVAPRDYRSSRGFLYRAHDAGARLAVVEITFSEAIVQRFGQIDFFSVLRDSPTTTPSVSVLTMVNMDGVTTSIEPRRQNLAGPQSHPGGIIYRPLAGDDRIPASWSAGEVCWQRTAAVGSEGVMLIHEVEAAECIPMDTYCNSGSCSASVGKNIRLPNPAALAGG